MPDESALESYPLAIERLEQIERTCAPGDPGRSMFHSMRRDPSVLDDGAGYSYARRCVIFREAEFPATKCLTTPAAPHPWARTKDCCRR
jgi:hypothetical protein